MEERIIKLFSKINCGIRQETLGYGPEGRGPRSASRRLENSVNPAVNGSLFDAGEDEAGLCLSYIVPKTHFKPFECRPLNA